MGKLFKEVTGFQNRGIEFLLLCYDGGNEKLTNTRRDCRSEGNIKCDEGTRQTSLGSKTMPPYWSPERDSSDQSSLMLGARG